jgi:cation diffusion facilitator CzcD-associated flavoprotein CzcO
VVIVGAGPQGLTTAAHLVGSGVDPGTITVVDPTGDWLVGWCTAMRRLGIAHLRSPSVHHPHPNPYALSDFARAARRSHELHHRYGLPSTALFEDFCRRVITEAALGDAVERGRVVAVDGDGQVTLESGAELDADHVVWATDPSVLPDVATLSGVVDHWPDAAPVTHGSTVAVVGGGLSAAHVVRSAVASGAHVEWLVRRDPVVRDFDTDPGWLGPKEMSRFLALDDMSARLQAVLDARGGGSVPAWILDEIVRDEHRGAVCRRVGHVDVRVSDGRPMVEVDGRRVECDRVVLALGTAPAVAADPALADLCRRSGTDVVGGRPVLDHVLRLPSSVVHVVGRLAQLHLGPTAGNLSGARRGAAQVVGAVVGVDAMFALLDA